MKTLVHRIAFFTPFLLACATAAAEGWFEKENAWERYTSLSFALPITSWGYDTDAADGESDDLVPIGFESIGYTFDYQAHHISPNKGFAVLTNWGFGGYSGDFELSDGTIKETEEVDGDEDEEVEEEYETFTLADNMGFMVYFNLGFGKAFTLAKGHVLIIPTAGVGISMYMLSKAEGTFDVEADADEDAEGESDEGTSTQKSFSYREVDLSLNVFLNVTALFMFSKKYGLSLSCQVSAPAFGIGISSTGSDSEDSSGIYTLDRCSSVNFTPAVGLCIHL